VNVGFIGYGEAAYNMSLGLKGEGLEGIRATDVLADHEVKGRLVRKRALEAGVTLVSSDKELARWADILIAAVPSSFTTDVCKGVRDSLRPEQLYVDVSASTPATKDYIWQAIRDTGVLFVDAAMLGSLPQDKHKVPITASGNGAQKFKDLMTPYGMRIKVAGDRPGAASAIKLVRSVFMKGLASCMYEMLQAADAYGVCDEVIASISTSLDGISFVQHLDRLITGTAIHAARRAAEVKGSLQMLEEADIDPCITTASIHKHELIAQYSLGDRFIERKPKGWKEIIELTRQGR